MQTDSLIPTSHHTHTADDVAFQLLQLRFAKHFHAIFMDDMAEKTIVIIPSLSLDNEILKTIKGIIHYEERMLCMLIDAGDLGKNFRIHRN